MLFRRNLPSTEDRRIYVSMSSKKPVTLSYLPAEGEKILLAKETTTFRGEVTAEKNPHALRWVFEGEHVENAKNSIKLEISY